MAWPSGTSNINLYTPSSPAFPSLLRTAIAEDTRIALQEAFANLGNTYKA